MTDQEIALKIGRTIRELQAKQTAYEVLLSRIRLNGKSIAWEEQIENDLAQDMAPSTPFGQSVAQLESELAEEGDDSPIQVLYRLIFLPQ